MRTGRSVDATTMTTKGQITVPREIRDRLGRDAAEDAAPGGPGRLAHAPRTAQGSRREHEPVQGDDSQIIGKGVDAGVDAGIDEATCAMSGRATANAARAVVPGARVVP